MKCIQLILCEKLILTYSTVFVSKCHMVPNLYIMSKRFSVYTSQKQDMYIHEIVRNQERLCKYLLRPRTLSQTLLYFICHCTFPFNPFSPRPAKTVPFVSLLCLTLHNFTRQGRASGWERVNSILFL